MLIIYGCSKFENNADDNIATTKQLQEMSTVKFQNLSPLDQRTLLNKIKSDSDWSLIIETNKSIMTKLVNANFNPEAFNFEDEDAFLNLLSMSKEEYMGKAVKVKAAAERLIVKYNFGQAGKEGCASCVAENDIKSKVDDLKLLLTKFKNNPSDLKKFNKATSLSSDFTSLVKTSAQALESDEDDELCCTLKFYECCALCAVMIEAFPLYLACCGQCYLSFCC